MIGLGGTWAFEWRTKMAQNDGQGMKIYFSHPELTYTSTTDDNGVGSRMYHQQNVYRWVKNGHGSAMTVGQVGFHADGDDENFFETIYDGASGDLSFMAGVVMATSLAKDSYGWIQILGVNTQVSCYASGGTAIAVGDSLIGADGHAYAIHGAASGTAPLHVRRLTALETLASSVTVATAKTCLVECF